MTNDHEQSLRKHLVELLAGGAAHAKFEDAIKGLPPKLRGTKPENFPHSPWMLLEHLRLAQWDILEFSRNRKHVSPKWPEGYWPKKKSPPNTGAWNKSVQQFRRDLKAMQSLVANSKTICLPGFLGATGRRSCGRPCLVADHNAYHVAQLVDVRRMLGAWGD